jgi:hypothetical protein
MRTSTMLLLVLILLVTACSPLTAPSQPSPYPNPPTETRPAPYSNPSTATMTKTALPSFEKKSDELLFVLDVSNPESNRYNPDSESYARFPDALKQITNLGPNASGSLASYVANAIGFPRPDAYLAAQTLISLGPDIATGSLPWIAGNLVNKKPSARAYALLVLAFTGKEASCTVGKIGPLLWDPDSSVRTASALALEKITGNDLIASEYEIDITPSVLLSDLTPDFPEGKVIDTARAWWLETGSAINWHPSYGLCDP